LRTVTLVPLPNGNNGNGTTTLVDKLGHQLCQIKFPASSFLSRKGPGCYFLFEYGKEDRLVNWTDYPCRAFLKAPSDWRGEVTGLKHPGVSFRLRPYRPGPSDVADWPDRPPSSVLERRDRDDGRWGDALPARTVWDEVRRLRDLWELVR